MVKMWIENVIIFCFIFKNFIWGMDQTSSIQIESLEQWKEFFQQIKTTNKILFLKYFKNTHQKIKRKLAGVKMMFR